MRKKEDFTQVNHSNSIESAGKNVQKTGSGQLNVPTDQKEKGRIEVEEHTEIIKKNRVAYKPRTARLFTQKWQT